MTTSINTGKTGRTEGINSPPAERPEGANFPIHHHLPEQLLFTREDWTEFRDLSRLPAKAGVRAEWLPRVAVKELVDNALDAGGEVQFRSLKFTKDLVQFVVQDAGPGLAGTDEELAVHFSIRRPLTSSKTRRMPTRGMLGNGLRVVVGVVLVGGGELVVHTRGRRLTLRPHMDGLTTIERVDPWDGTGMRIEVTLGGEMARLAWEDRGLYEWAEVAKLLAVGERYKGESSPWWYGVHSFWELLRAAGTTRVERVVEGLAGCSAKRRTREVVGECRGREAGSLDQEEAGRMLARARQVSREVSADRLGLVGERGDFVGYARTTGRFERDGATVPYVVEVWARKAAHPDVQIAMNRTPIVSHVSCRREDGKSYAVFGAEISHLFHVGQRRCGEYQLLIHVLAPYVPLTSSGKEPDLTPMRDHILESCTRAVKRCRNASPKGERGLSQKQAILNQLAGAVDRLTTGGNIFSLRQLYYAIRPALIEEFGKEPEYGNFSRVIGEYEDERGEIDGMYRDDRGTLYHPHTGESIPLGTRTVAGYERPAWGFNKILYCEKEGFFPILQKAGWPERFDCALLTSKGFASRAAREVMRLMGETGEPITFYCIHDADGAGTVIYDSLSQALAPHDVTVVNLGLDPAEAREMGLQAEQVQERLKRDGAAAQIPTGSYLPVGDREWLQTRRIELNAMTTEQFLNWLSRKLGEHDGGKVRPPEAVVCERARSAARAALTRRLTEQAIRAARVDARVADLLAEYDGSLKSAIAAADDGLGDALSATPTAHWSTVVDAGIGRVVESWAS